MEIILVISLIVNIVTIPFFLVILYYAYALKKSGLFTKSTAKAVIGTFYRSRAKQVGVDYHTYRNVMGTEEELVNSSKLLRFLELKDDTEPAIKESDFLTFLEAEPDNDRLN